MRILYTCLFFVTLSLSSCADKTETDESTEETVKEQETKKPIEVNLSIAQWSLHQPIFEGKLDPLDFAKKAKELGFGGIEYVTQLYKTEGATFEEKRTNVNALAKELKARAEEHEVKSLLIMIDQEGDLASSDAVELDSAYLKHCLWIDAAEYLGCHSIRVNLFGNEDNKDEWVKNSAYSMQRLSEYAAPKNINVIVENHGDFSCNAKLVVKVMEKVNLPNCGTLPDFGNFCLKREGGVRWGAPCLEEYDKYSGVSELMPYAKAVSAKTIAFDENGKETTIDYEKMLSIVYKNGYNGYLGVEWESENISSEKGIQLTKELITSTVKKLNSK